MCVWGMECVGKWISIYTQIHVCVCVHEGGSVGDVGDVGDVGVWGCGRCEGVGGVGCMG